MDKTGSIVVRKKKRQAQALLAGNRLQEAKELYLQLCRIDRDDPENWAMTGVIMGRLGQMQEAASCLQRATALRPGFAEAHYNLGKAFRAMGQLEAAASSYETALRLQPDWADALYNLGNVLDLLGRLRDAESCYRRVLAIIPDHVNAQKALGNVLMSLGDLDESLDCYERLGKADPASIDARIGKAKVLERRGEIDQASAIARQLIESGTRNLELDFLYASMCGTAEAIARLESWLGSERPEIDRPLLVTLHFRLGELYDRQQDYQAAFRHFQTANRLKARTFDVPEFSSFLGDMISVFTPGFMSTAPRATHGSRRPIFIVGMPRSGTTLVEQILSSHPDVFGAGELEEIRRISLEMLKVDRNGKIVPGCLDDLTADTCNRFAARYLDHLDGLAGGAARVTDKMPQNFIGVGVIALLFPEARIIHCRRDPLDTCLSCYVNDFGATHDYATDLETLGRYYREYQRLMRHWKEVLGIPMLEIDYEALVADQENVTRGLLDYCGLEWNEQCLRFHDNRRAVATSSYDQVRRPVYSRSVGRWRNYEPWLGPLIESLGTG
jgi:tetratricopeptide (TPR) repeat protein